MKFPNKDVRGALLISATIVAVGFLVFVVSGCAVNPDYRPELEIGMAQELREPVVGSNPVGIARVRQPLWVRGCNRVVLEYEHLSSIPDQNDTATVDQLGVVARICLGRTK